MSYIYLIPLLISLIIGAFYLITTKISHKKMIDKPFLKEFPNELYALSYLAPFKWFINPNEDEKRIKDLKKRIVEAGESHRLNYRVYVTIQILTFIIAIILFLFFSMIADNSAIIIKFLFNITLDISGPDDLLKIKIIIGLILLSLTLVPSVYLKKKATKNKFFFLKDLPILQLFVILMIKAKRPLSEVIYVLSNTNTIYKPIFATSYRMYVGNREEGLNYLRESFEGTKFEDTVVILDDYGKYSKELSLTVLENNLKDITEYTNTLKRRKDIGSNVFSQISLIVPFLAVILLALSPMVYYGINLLEF